MSNSIVFFFIMKGSIHQATTFIIIYFLPICNGCFCPPFCPPTTSTTTATPPECPAPSCECGEVNRPAKIAGGNETGPNEYPWNIFVCLLRIGSSCWSWCGGSLLSNQHVLTAAHCVDGGKNPDEIFLYMGETHDTFKT